jgi:hypothetical protein
MNDLRKAAEQALEALQDTCDYLPAKSGVEREVDEAITALQVALAQPEQEPVAWMQVTKYGNKLLAFTEPPLEPPCYTGEFVAAKNYPLFLKKENT